MLNYDTFPMSPNAYEPLRFQTIFQLEAKNTPADFVPIFDTKGIPTIGIGFNLTERFVLDAIWTSFGFNPQDAAEIPFIQQIESIAVSPPRLR